MRRERSGEIGERQQGILPSTGYSDRAHARPLNPWQRFLLERLHRLVALKEDYEASTHREEWLANALGSHGVALEAGHLVMTGSLHTAFDVVAGDVVRADFDRLGSVTVTFT